MKTELSTLQSSWQLARLIPGVAESKKEERATSCLLASFMVVPIFARKVLASVGAPVGKRIKIECYTEVAFKSSSKEKSSRPDGFIVISNGKHKWTALIESKIGNADLTTEQIESYLDLAKKHGINAVITISNQFATTPTHLPIKVSKVKLRSVDLYHFSWLSLKSKAILLTGNKRVDDPEQAFILNELIRYLEHPASGVSALTRMPGTWKDTCNSIQQRVPLNRSSELVENAVAAWHQLLRHLSLNLSIAISQPVGIVLSRAREKNAELNFQKDCCHLSNEGELVAEFDIPNAASKLRILVDLKLRTINFSMKLDSPKDRARATAPINWFTRQLRGKDIKNVAVRAYWPRRIPMTQASLNEVITNPAVLINQGITDLPTYLEVIRVVDLAVRFKGVKTFVEDCSREFPLFYTDVGQHLTKWVAKAPKVKAKSQAESVIPTILSGADVIALAKENAIDD